MEHLNQHVSVDSVEPGKPFDWVMKLDERQRNEMEFARLYARKFAHGTDGHNRLLLVAKMADLLDSYFMGN